MAWTLIQMQAVLTEAARSGGSIVVNTLDCQSRDRTINPPRLGSFG